MSKYLDIAAQPTLSGAKACEFGETYVIGKVAYRMTNYGRKERELEPSFSFLDQNDQARFLPGNLSTAGKAAYEANEIDEFVQEITGQKIFIEEERFTNKNGSLRIVPRAKVID